MKLLNHHEIIIQSEYIQDYMMALIFFYVSIYNSNYSTIIPDCSFIDTFRLTLTLILQIN